MVEMTLKQFGLSDKEVGVYLAALKLGPAAVRKIAKEANVNRGTTYDILRSLMKIGLVSYYNKDKHQYFSAENPESLREVLNRKWSELAKMENAIIDILPQLKTIYDRAGDRPLVKFFEGEAGVKNILLDVLDTVAKQKDKEYCVYSGAGIRERLYNDFVDYTSERVKKQIRVRVIAIGPGGAEAELAQRRWLTQEENTPPNYILIYGNKVVTISLNDQQDLFGVVVDDAQVAATQRLLFNFVWGKI